MMSNVLYVEQLTIMKPFPPLPPSLRLGKAFKKDDVWYIIDSEHGLIKIIVINTNEDNLICRDGEGRIYSHPIHSGLILSLSEKIWLRVMINKASQKNNPGGFHVSIISDAYAGNTDAIVFINWLHRVQRKIDRQRKRDLKYIILKILDQIIDPSTET